MKFTKKLALRAGIVAAAMLAGTGPAQAQPNPVLYLTGLEYYSAGGKNWVRHRYDVFNKDQYPAAMFAAGAGAAALRDQHQFVALLGRLLRFDGQAPLRLLRARKPGQPRQDLVRDRGGHGPAQLRLHRDPRSPDQQEVQVEPGRDDAVIILPMRSMGRGTTRRVVEGYWRGLCRLPLHHASHGPPPHLTMGEDQWALAPPPRRCHLVSLTASRPQRSRARRQRPLPQGPGAVPRGVGQARARRASS